MAEHKCKFLSQCCDSEVLYGSEINFDESGAEGVCSSCHEFTPFYEEGLHTPWDDDYKPIPIVPDHDCDFVSVCCGARPVWELDLYLTGYCGSCHEGTGFECEEYEDCDNNSYAILEREKRKSYVN